MCSGNEAIRKLIDSALVGGIFDLTFTGWKADEADGDRYSHQRNSEQNIFITSNGVNAGGIAITQGSNLNNGFGFTEQGREKLSIETVRGILVTALAVSSTKRGQDMASGFAKTVEALASNCFHPVRYDMRIHGNRDPFLSVEMTNGMQTVSLATAERPFTGELADFKLDIPHRYHLGSRVADILVGNKGATYGYSPTGIQVEVDGKWIRAAGLTHHNVREEDKEVVDGDETISLPALSAIFGETERGKLHLKCATAIIEQLTRVYKRIDLVRVDMSQYSTHGKGTIRLDYRSADGLNDFGMDFERE